MKYVHHVMFTLVVHWSNAKNSHVSNPSACPSTVTLPPAAFVPVSPSSLTVLFICADSVSHAVSFNSDRCKWGLGVLCAIFLTIRGTSFHHPSLLELKFYILLTVNPVMILGKWPTWCTILYYVFIFIFIFNSLHVSSPMCSKHVELKIKINT
jgi:hypothetical protein